jgi:hypothetical protein
MITQQVVYVNIKNKAQFELKDCLNYYFTSNHPDAFYLDPNDRRFFVHDLGDKKYPADLYRDQFEPWLNDGGAAAIRYHLENLDLSHPIVGGDPKSLIPHRFNPGAAAPQSHARKEMVLANRNDAEEWLDDLLENPLNGLDSPRTLVSGPELYRAFTTARKGTRIPYKTFCSHLRQRIKAVYSDNKLNLTNGQTMRVYPLGAMRVECLNATHESLVSTYEAEREE